MGSQNGSEELSALHSEHPYAGELGVGCVDALGEYVKTQDGWTPEAVNYEGLRVRCENSNERGWFLLRLSLHDPLLPLNIESDVAGGNLAIAKKLVPFFKGFDKLDSSSIAGFAG